MGRKGTGFLALGLTLILTAGALTMFNSTESTQAANASDAIVHKLLDVVPALAPEPGTTLPDPTLWEPEFVRNPQVEMPVETMEGYGYIGVLRIPALELELPVMADWSYPQLKIAPCRYQGSAYLDNLVLCAHNYATHFGRLRELHTGDEVSFTDMDGNLFVYQVLELEILQRNAVADMTQGDWDLTLFTCTVGGQSRVTLRCQRISPIS